jgi:phosphatidylglycerophosphate synthase
MIAAMPRRALATREASWAKRLAAALGRIGVRPNAVSIASLACAFTALAAFLSVPWLAPSARPIAFVAAAAAIQLRLLCNLLDGMLAVEGGLGTRTGDLYNEIPDRLADVAILVGAGCAIGAGAAGALLGWGAAASAIFTAYVRLLGGSLGLTQQFIGPMAKQHRMFVITLAAMVSAGESFMGWPTVAMRSALVLVLAGSLVTAWRRIRRMARELEAR